MSRRVLGTVLEIAVPLALLALWAVLVGRLATPTTSRRSPTSSRRSWTRGCSSASASDVVPSLVRLGARLRDRVRRWRSALGLALGLSRPLRRALDPIVQFLRAIPPPALLPFGILVLGVGNVDEGLHHRVRLPVAGAAEHDRRRRGRRPDAARDRARRTGSRPRDRLLRVIAAGGRAADLRRHAHEPVARADPDGDHRDGAPARTASATSCCSRSASFAIPEMWSGILLLGILGYVLNAVFLLVERRVLRWHRGARASALS